MTSLFNRPWQPWELNVVPPLGFFRSMALISIVSENLPLVLVFHVLQAFKCDPRPWTKKWPPKNVVALGVKMGVKLGQKIRKRDHEWKVLLKLSLPCFDAELSWRGNLSLDYMANVLLGIFWPLAKLLVSGSILVSYKSSFVVVVRGEMSQVKTGEFCCQWPAIYHVKGTETSWKFWIFFQDFYRSSNPFTVPKKSLDRICIFCRKTKNLFGCQSNAQCDLVKMATPWATQNKKKSLFSWKERQLLSAVKIQGLPRRVRLRSPLGKRKMREKIFSIFVNVTLLPPPLPIFWGDFF